VAQLNPWGHKFLEATAVDAKASKARHRRIMAGSRLAGASADAWLYLLLS